MNMAETLQYKSTSGDLIYIKDDLSTGQFWMIQKLSKVKSVIDEELLQINLIRALVEKIVTEDGREITERIEVVNFIRSMSAKDWMKLGKKLTQVFSGDDEEETADPKEIVLN
jgi:hypothetical protein